MAMQARRPTSTARLPAATPTTLDSNRLLPLCSSNGDGGDGLDGEAGLVGLGGFGAGGGGGDGSGDGRGVVSTSLGGGGDDGRGSTASGGSGLTTPPRNEPAASQNGLQLAPSRRSTVAVAIPMLRVLVSSAKSTKSELIVQLR